MKAAGLKAIDTVIESTATLLKSKHPSNQKLVDMIASRISGVISNPIPFHPPQHQQKLTPTSGPKIHPLPIQHRPQRPGNRHQNHPRETRAQYHGARGSGLGGRQRDGDEGEYCVGDG